ncbi:hypothetical protein ACFL1E_00800 [Candidatus Omnitrophota bacterium]
MKYFRMAVLFLCFVLCVSGFAWAESMPGYTGGGFGTSPAKVIPKSIKGAKAVPGPFQVKKTEFSTVVIDNQTRLVAAVIFNKNLDAGTVQQNVNIRMLKQDENNFWVDASTQNNTVNIRPNFVTWVSGAPLENGTYKMHLRGTIRSADGVSLDCDGDGKGEGGYPPPYESQLYQADGIELEEMDPGRIPGNMF